ncbi:DUF5105 domain-containing protein [Bacillus thermotolerans]|uniref:DUF4352 domain-containing protein n=1 Tax=Bacillus thermotolerans TaxID=1221996 RepID=A0A0F5I2D5_BACTR|nr:DUF5105 domain-containing protein [Bacillus thermotolerans]KKB39824.1 hypothetical protein QY95_02041 [Bacillus thermotolerans]
MKKLGVLTLALLVLFSLAACGGSQEASGSTGKSKIAEAAIEQAEYILAGEDGESQGEERGLLAVDVKVKNNSDSTIHISSYDGVYLYDGDEQLSPEQGLYGRGIDLEHEGSGAIGAGKAKTIPVYFNVEKGKTYEIGLTPRLSEPGEEADEILLTLDTTEYEESYQQLEEPAKALTAYIDVIYLGKENADYEKLVTADKEAVQQKAKDEFKKQLGLSITKDVTSEEAVTYYNSYQSALREKAEAKTKTVEKAGDKAVVKLDYSTVSLDNLYEELYNYQREYRENTGGYDTEKEQQYALSKFDTIVQLLGVANSSNGANIHMIKKDGKWTVDTSDYNSDTLIQAFAEGKAY